MYRRGQLPETHSDIHKNASDEVQFEGVEFSDGRCALRWLTPIRSVSVWDSLADALAIHGHPEYESDIVWHDPAPEGRDNSIHSDTLVPDKQEQDDG